MELIIRTQLTEQCLLIGREKGDIVADCQIT